MLTPNTTADTSLIVGFENSCRQPSAVHKCLQKWINAGSWRLTKFDTHFTTSYSSFTLIGLNEKESLVRILCEKLSWLMYEVTFYVFLIVYRSGCPRGRNADARMVPPSSYLQPLVLIMEKHDRGKQNPSYAFVREDKWRRSNYPKDLPPPFSDFIIFIRFRAKGSDNNNGGSLYRENCCQLRATEVPLFCPQCCNALLCVLQGVARILSFYLFQWSAKSVMNLFCEECMNAESFPTESLAFWQLFR